MKQYLDAVRNVLNKGTRKENRTGVDTLSTFGEYYECDLREGYPLLTTKNINFKNIVVENLWFLSGEPKIDLLKKHGCKFWDAWADKDGYVPSAYGNFWRHFPVHGWVNSNTGQVLGNGQIGKFEDGDKAIHSYNDQIDWVLKELRRNPMSRRMVVSAWAPGNAQTSKLPPCHSMFMLNVQNAKCSNCFGEGSSEESMDGPHVDCYECKGTGTEKTLNLHLTQRSCDMALGVPYNIAGYAFLLQLFAHLSGLKPGIFAHTLVDAHVYTCKPDGSMAEYDHIPGLQKQLKRTPKELPGLTIDHNIKELEDIKALLEEDTESVMSHFKLEGYHPHDAINFKVAV